MFKILPLTGIDNVSFGITRNNLISLMGEPDEISRDEDDSYTSEAYYYWSRGLSYNFHSETGFNLSTIEVGAVEHDIFGSNLSNLSIQEIVQWSNENKLDFNVVHDSDGAVERLEYDKLSMFIWVEEGRFSSIQFSAESS